jgi:hypothetical protein
VKVPRVNRFSADARAEIELRLEAGDFESYRAFSKELKRRGWHICKSALHAHRRRLLEAKKQKEGQR